MVVYKCPDCGKEYEKKARPENGKCVECGLILKMKTKKDDEVVSNKEDVETTSIEEQVIRKKRITSVDSMTPVHTISSISTNEGTISDNKYSVRRQKPTEAHDMSGNNFSSNIPVLDISKKDKSNTLYIEGKVVSVSKDEAYKRYFWEKIVDKVKYKQHVANVQNTIYLRGTNQDGCICNNNVIIYGNIKGGEKIIQTGMRLRAYGKWNDRNEYIAERIVCDESYEISIRTEPQDVLYILSPLLLFILIALVYAVSSGVVKVYNKISCASIVLPFFISFVCCCVWGKKRIRRPLYFKIRLYFTISLLVEIVWLIIKLSL